MSAALAEFETVVLRRDLPEARLEAGDVGTVVLAHAGGAGFEVEFATLAGETIAVVTVPAEDLRAVAPDEIAHVRRVA
jgi:hypothetical protein